VVSVLLLVGTVLVSLLLGASVSRRVREMQKHLTVVSEGDFSQTLPIRGRDEISAIGGTVNSLLDSLNRLLGQVKDQVESLKLLSSDLGERMGETTEAVVAIEANLVNSHAQLNEQNESVTAAVAAANSLSGATDNLSGAFTSQLEILGSSSAAIEQIIANIRSVNSNAAKAEASSRILAEVSRDGQTKLDLVAKAVHEIARSSENLVQVTAIINDIADKTNLLAMNASIEAAHAGVAGRGFGVVANEIRTLAEQAASQAKEIAQDLQVVNENIHSIDAATGLAVEVFRKIVTQTDLVGSVVQQVQAAMDEQSRGGTQVLEGLHQLNDFNDKVGGAVEELKRGETEILEKIETLARQNALVNVNNEAVLGKTGEIRVIVDKTNVLSESTRRQIEVLEAETARFQTLPSS
jgi:methyl-accepting chemotaxis protein